MRGPMVCLSSRYEIRKCEWMIRRGRGIAVSFIRNSILAILGGHVGKLTVSADVQISGSHVTPLPLSSRQIALDEHRLSPDRVDGIVLYPDQALRSEPCSVDDQVHGEPSISSITGQAELFGEVCWELEVVGFV
jgi:hypothetical protein